MFRNALEDDVVGLALLGLALTLGGMGVYCVSGEAAMSQTSAKVRAHSLEQVSEMLNELVNTILKYCRTQDLKGAYKTGPGKTAPWRIPPEAIEHYQRTRPRLGAHKKETATVAPVTVSIESLREPMSVPYAAKPTDLLDQLVNVPPTRAEAAQILAFFLPMVADSSPAIEATAYGQARHELSTAAHFDLHPTYFEEGVELGHELTVRAAGFLAMARTATRLMAIWQRLSVSSWTMRLRVWPSSVACGLLSVAAWSLI